MTRDVRWIKDAHPSFLLILFLVLGFSAEPAAAANAVQPHEMVSICQRTDPVRIAIQKEIAAARFASGERGAVRCDRVGADELLNLGSLQIVEKDLAALKPGDFDGLGNLKTLDLEGNNIKTLEPGVLAALCSLENLFAARNPLGNVDEAFHGLPRLRRIDLSGCALSSIAAGAFDGNPQLESVFLSDNELTRLPDGLFINHHFLQTLDLSGNWLFELPGAFISEKAPLRSLDLSRNLISEAGQPTVEKYSTRSVVNLSGNPFDTKSDRRFVEGLFNLTPYVPGNDKKHVPSFPRTSPRTASTARTDGVVRDAIENLRFFVRSHWHVPLEISVVYSASDVESAVDPGRRAREERLALRQLTEIRQAYRRAAFDFFDVQIQFDAPDSSRKAPAVSFDKKTLGLILVLKAPENGRNRACLISDDLMLETLADHFSRNRSIAWYAGESQNDLRAALKRDYEKIARMDDELRFDIIRLDDLIETAMERMDQAGGKKFFSETELTGARLIQFRMMLTFQRLENTMARWRLAESDPAFPYRPETRLILAQAAGMYETYLDGFLTIVLGNRPRFNILDEDWYRLNPIFKILDSEVPAGFFNLEGRISTRIPAGAVRDLLKNRLNAPLLHFLFGLKTLDRKVSSRDIETSPLQSEMRQARKRIAKNRHLLDRQYRISDFQAFKTLWEVKVKNSVKFPIYRVTTGIACLIGDTRFSSPSPAVTDEQIEELKGILKPGDLIVSRSDYYLSNAFLGGFWPHGILYLGPKDIWSRLRLPDGTNLAEDPWIFENILPNYSSAKDDRPAMVIEAISEGVVFNSLEDAVAKDYLVIFRPRFAPEKQEAAVAQAIRRALRYHGRAYDFDFDFFTDDKLVCTELLYRAYHPDINFLIQKQAVVKPDPPVPGMVKKAGRDTMPAGEIVKLALYMLDNTKPDPAVGYPGQTLEFVRLYMKQAKDKPARIFEGADGIAALRMTLRDDR